jgi:hypothetical protein
MALTLTLVVVSASVGMAERSTAVARLGPEAIEMQQRARVAADLLFRGLARAGSGVDAGPRAGTLVQFLPPVVPRRLSGPGADPHTIVRDDAVTMLYVPQHAPQTTLQHPMTTTTDAMLVAAAPSCPIGAPVCGFEAGTSAVIFDTDGHADVFTVAAGSHANRLEREQLALSHPYGSGSVVAGIEQDVYYFDAARGQLRHTDGRLTDAPVVDDVVEIRFRYLGEHESPRQPRPVPGAANCLYDAAGNFVPLATLSAAGESLAELPVAALRDGPWCGSGSSAYDADLLRIRQVRVSLRVRAAPVLLRRDLPEHGMSFDVAPRNLNLGR